MIRKLAILALSISSGLIFVNPAVAASDEECANWLCLPAGYPGGSNCGGPYDAMVDRIRDGKSPLPNYSSCVTQGSYDPEFAMSYDFGPATFYNGKYHKNETCRMRGNNEYKPSGCNGRNYWFFELADAEGSPVVMQNGDGTLGTVVGNTRYIPR